MNPEVRLLALKLLLKGAVLRLSTAREGFAEVKGQGYLPFMPPLEAWEWGDGEATLKHGFVFGGGDQTVYSYALMRSNPFGGGDVILQAGLIEDAPCRVRVKGSRIDVQVTMRMK